MADTEPYEELVYNFIKHGIEKNSNLELIWTLI